MERKSGLLQVAEGIVARAKSGGAGMAEVYINNNNELTVEVRGGKVETMKLAEETGLGLRLMLGGKVGFAYTSDLNAGALDDVVGQALANASGTSRDPHRVMPGPAGNYPRLNLYDPAIKNATVEEKIELARTMEREALANNPAVRIIESSSYADAEVEVVLVNSLGTSLSYRGAYCGIHISLVAGEGDDSQTGFAMDYRLDFANIDAGKVGREAARRAVRMLGARPVATGKVPVVFEPYVATGFLGLLSPSLSADAVQKGRSLFAGKVNTRVASDLINIVDDGTLSGGIASAPFDGEGVPTSRTGLISGGILNGYLHNTYTASKDGVVSTGNGVRGSFKATPEVGATNLFIEAGKTSPDDIIGGIKNGFLVTEVMGMHTANPISGDFSLGAAGLWIENGRIASPVRGVAMAGNILDLLKNVDAVGNDLNFFGGRGAPTLLIKEMSISGH
jgi:PmbA protein